MHSDAWIIGLAILAGLVILGLILRGRRGPSPASRAVSAYMSRGSYGVHCLKRYDPEAYAVGKNLYNLPD